MAVFRPFIFGDRGIKVIKLFGGFFGAALFFYKFVPSFSAEEFRFLCSRGISLWDFSHSATVYIKLTEYRWWIRLWKDSDGTISIELPSGLVPSYWHLVKTGDKFQIYDFRGDFQGDFSTLSNKLYIDNSPEGSFEGTCKRIAR